MIQAASCQRTPKRHSHAGREPSVSTIVNNTPVSSARSSCLFIAWDVKPHQLYHNNKYLTRALKLTGSQLSLLHEKLRNK